MNTISRCLLALCVLLVSLAACEEDRNLTPEEQLPAITDTGAQTFGCLVDGKLFKPRKHPFSSYITLQCYYQKVKGINQFVLSAGDYIDRYNMVFNGDSVHLTGPTTLNYAYPERGNFYGRCGNTRGFRFEFSTYQNTAGEFKISRFDTVRQIISGTFWFDAVDTVTNRKVEVRQGRFDVHFTR